MPVYATGLKEPLVITVATKDKTIPNEKDNFTAMINPQNYDNNSNVVFNKNKTIGRNGGDPKFSHIDEEKIGFDIVLDGTGAVGQPKQSSDVISVKDQLDNLYNVVSYNGSTHEPNYSRVSWGNLIFWGRCEKLTVKNTLFKPDGSVLRAKVRIEFISFVKDEEESLKSNKSSPDLSHIIETKAGDTLVHLCAQIYDDPSYYLDIARINGIDDFSQSHSGTKTHLSTFRITKMADSVDTTAVVDFLISVDGKSVGYSLGVNRIVVTREVNKIPTAIITINDGDMPTGTFPVSDDDSDIELQPGKSIDISVGYGSSKDKIFTGIIVKHGLSINAHSGSEIVIECKELAVQMTLGRKNENFVKSDGGTGVKDQTTLNSIIGNYSKLSADVEATTAELSSLVQYNMSDWDFLISRAEANGMLVCVLDNKVSVKAPDLSEKAIFTAEYGKNIFECRANVDATNQLAKVSSVAWDLNSLKVTKEPVSSTTDSSARGTINGDMSKVMGLKEFRLQSQTPLPSASLKDWASGQLTKAKLSELRGFIKIQGRHDAEIGKMIELKGVGKRFSGNVFVSGVEHTVEEGNWVTEVKFGCSSEWFTQSISSSSPDASGLLGPANGLQIGIVKKLEKDPDNQFKIFVEVPVSEAQTPGVWARLAGFYASSSFGAVFLPEIGDEVVLGYFNSDPSYPVILGSLYSAKHKSPVEFKDDNFTKAIITKTKLKVEFDDEKKVMTLETPGGHSIVMSDDKTSIVLEDSNGNTVKMEKGGITLDSPKDIEITAGGKITMSATNNVDIAAKSGSLTGKGLNVELTAQAGFTAKGNATAEVSAAGNTTVKGAMVMIN